MERNIFRNLVKLYENPNKFYEDAYFSISLLKPEIKAKFAIYLYVNSIVSLEKASEIAGMSLFEFKELLKIKGINAKVYAGTKEELSKSVEFLREAK